jgi:hypothetical protein
MRDAFLMAWSLKKFNQINLYFQLVNVTLINCRTVVSIFIEKTLSFRHNISKKEFHQFAYLSSIKKNYVTSEEIKDTVVTLLSLN